MMLVPQLHAALQKLNPTLAPEAIIPAISVDAFVSPQGETGYSSEMDRC
jgi:hypothetical protein